MRTQSGILAAVVIGLASGLTGGSALQAQDERAPTALRGDLNGNGIFDFDDVAILRSVIGGARMTLPASMYDVDQNRRIDEWDQVMLLNWAQRQAALDDRDEPAPAPTERSLRGDLDGDGTLTNRDLLILMEMVFGELPARENFDIADVDADGRLTIGDLIALTEIMLGRREPSYV